MKTKLVKLAVSGSLVLALAGTYGSAVLAQVRSNVTGALDMEALANAEVIVSSSGNLNYRGMTNTDAQGRFNLSGVPAGGIDVLVRRNGVTVARGAAMFLGGDLNQAQLLHIGLVSPDVQPKNGPVGQ